MIPLFPAFKKLRLSDKLDIEKFTTKYPPSSDFNFAGLWSYNTKEKIEASVLNENLVIKSFDYVTLKPFYSFLGKNKVNKTVKELISLAKSEKINQRLYLIPEIGTEKDAKMLNDYKVQADEDNFDYILSVPQISKLSGNNYRGKRNFVNRFMRNYPSTSVSLLNLKDLKTKKQIENLFTLWKQQNNKSEKETENEFIALKRLMESASHFKLMPIGIFINKLLIAFSIDEIVKDYGIIHFEKADNSYVGIFQYLKQQTAQHLEKCGCEYINYEQDLGIEGLRKSKQSWHPVSYIKKYIISAKD